MIHLGSYQLFAVTDEPSCLIYSGEPESLAEGFGPGLGSLGSSLRRLCRVSQFVPQHVKSVKKSQNERTRSGNGVECPARVGSRGGREGTSAIYALRQDPQVGPLSLNSVGPARRPMVIGKNGSKRVLELIAVCANLWK